jgi:Tfp pilus assembly pilus retraction ATPase PilT
MEYKHFLEQLLDTVISQNASDLHFSEGRYATIRVNSDLVPLMDTKIHGDG